VQVLGQHARSVEDPHLTYEVARAAYQLGAMDGALQAFAALSGAACTSLPIRLNAASRLVAHYARSGSDLDACGHWSEVAAAAMPAADAGRMDFPTGLAVSRVHRAAALYASRRRDAASVAATLEAADAADRALEPLAEGDLRRLELGQNRRLILEAALKAFVATGGRVDPLDAAVSADRLTELDPWDPYTRLTVGDAHWILGDDERALASYDVATQMGTLVGAHAAHRGAVLLARTGRRGEAKVWLARATALDPAATADELSGA
jgi:tetratricopeptide (TPR) repeat protein